MKVSNAQHLIVALLFATLIVERTNGYNCGRLGTTASRGSLRYRLAERVVMASSLTSSDAGAKSPSDGGASNENNSKDKEAFLNSLDEAYKLNPFNDQRKLLLNKMIYNKQVKPTIDGSSSSAAAVSISNPGSIESFRQVATGTWKVVYAPHMTTMAKLGGGEFQVEYILRDDLTMDSHARYDFPLFKQRGYLSVSGTYGSVNDLVCRVDFDQSWVKQLPVDEDIIVEKDVPYQSITEVPDSASKQVITTIGKLFFLEQVSVFPISYLDDDLCVFDFELLGTRICARKVKRN
uniref:Plastid lipid-associated protein/fibrillin conserved domain-containing protein n=1 Tax=Helicotheca tamesis TaxID=374047 RepID=A0A6U0ESK7_9STRA|mmetsp:Transcript_13938/g.19083  ORF Transcript_13938/g.19083 Transcript_13938/m.19083 type:complete len:292 (+) Transcript_13938:58-933(+)